MARAAISVVLALFALFAAGCPAGSEEETAAVAKLVADVRGGHEVPGLALPSPPDPEHWIHAEYREAIAAIRASTSATVDSPRTSDSTSACRHATLASARGTTTLAIVMQTKPPHHVRELSVRRRCGCPGRSGARSCRLL